LPANAICLCAHWQLTHRVRQQAGSYGFCVRLDDVDRPHSPRTADDRSHPPRGSGAGDCYYAPRGNDLARPRCHESVVNPRHGEVDRLARYPFFIQLGVTA
jgi:hypothetical protein